MKAISSVDKKRFSYICFIRPTIDFAYSRNLLVPKIQWTKSMSFSEHLSDRQLAIEYFFWNDWIGKEKTLAGIDAFSSRVIYIYR